MEFWRCTEKNLKKAIFLKIYLTSLRNLVKKRVNHFLPYEKIHHWFLWFAGRSRQCLYIRLRF